MRENPVRGYEIPIEKNPRRPVATTDRYEAIRGVSDQVEMEILWHGKRTKQRSYLSELLDLAYATGRRISAICQLRYDDLRLEKTAEQPYGAIRWPGDTDKEGMEWTSPLNPIARAAIDRVLAERRGIGAVPMFPCPKQAGASIRYELASDWLKKAETLVARLPRRVGYGVKDHSRSRRCGGRWMENKPNRPGSLSAGRPFDYLEGGSAHWGASGSPMRPSTCTATCTPVRRRAIPETDKSLTYGKEVPIRDVAQLGSAPEWGSGGRRFESGRPD